MKKQTRVLFVSIIVALVMTVAIIFIPNSIENYYHLPDQGASWYYWKFPEPDMAARISAWSLFIIHFLTVGFVMNKLKANSKSSELSKYNYYLLFVNLFFIVLHYLHTIIWYDALAQDTPVWSSQGSVIVMLILILIMENRRRGLFFGKKVALPKESVNFIYKNHSIYIALATIFTFWFHPMENTIGHLFGFFYIYLLFIQMSFAKTRIHNNYLWTFVLEITVLFHGTTVAIATKNAPFSMFFFGFGAVFFITQIYGLKLNKKAINFSQLGFIAIILLYYLGVFDGSVSFKDINEVFRIPVIDYVLVFVFVYAIYVPIFIKKRLIKRG
ncbi:hypothetical protein CI105_02870 [Candidatus Izimaplasma bacterium ZiA1]|uniref:hypothetical protein n=1 Tax=Candidatus Izimoplasma sp. ZiA1 TaxID=2024899 RepID=UPI000BAA8CCC|nr:hypothetical protein CI105_02870 [Candidatus Izimaplasma bacterium ZiA1]